MNTTISLGENENLTPTMRLRFVERKVAQRIVPGVETGYTGKVLQQMFTNQKGQRIWQDVPLELED